jgi:hypothetical protein
MVKTCSTKIISRIKNPNTASISSGHQYGALLSDLAQRMESGITLTGPSHNLCYESSQFPCRV